MSVSASLLLCSGLAAAAAQILGENADQHYGQIFSRVDSDLNYQVECLDSDIDTFL